MIGKSNEGKRHSSNNKEVKLLLQRSSLSFAPFLALHAAALSGHVSTVKLLLENNAQVDATDVMKHTPLFRACEMGHKDVIQTLIKG